jgi:predicted transcriptional regulator
MIRKLELSSRRSKFQLSVEVLECIKQGEEKPTRIMYSCNLSWKSLKDILENLTEQGLLEKNTVFGKKRSKRNYEITPKGENVLQYYNMVSGLIEIDGIKK